MNVIISGTKINTDNYIKLVNCFYNDNGFTTEIQINTLVLLYRITTEDKIFAILFKTHLALLNKISQEIFNKYKQHLYDEDLNDIKSMVYEEFIRRVYFYKIPPVAPFSKYIKLYLQKWCNTYVKIMVKKNQRCTLQCDILKEELDVEFGQFAYSNGVWQFGIDNIK